jgi:hypothetical protein
MQNVSQNDLVYVNAFLFATTPVAEIIPRKCMVALAEAEKNSEYNIKMIRKFLSVVLYNEPAGDVHVSSVLPEELYPETLGVVGDDDDDSHEEEGDDSPHLPVSTYTYGWRNPLLAILQLLLPAPHLAVKTVFAMYTYAHMAQFGLPPRLSLCHDIGENICLEFAQHGVLVFVEATGLYKLGEDAEDKVSRFVDKDDADEEEEEEEEEVEELEE